ncbi:hypothetical protein BDL97_19G096200 [Sphagnum fallax]|nr:hypothetical protein BDL97_19G096200 [Sphagnum fallax]
MQFLELASDGDQSSCTAMQMVLVCYTLLEEKADCILTHTGQGRGWELQQSSTSTAQCSRPAPDCECSWFMYARSFDGDRKLVSVLCC